MIDLKTVIQKHPKCLADRSAFRSTLMDLYPSEKRMVNILTAIYECGLASKLKAAKSISADELQRYIMQLDNEYGINQKYAQDAIIIWAEAYHITVSRTAAASGKAPTIQSNASATVPTGQPVTSAKPPVVFVSGSESDYKITQKSDGWYIEKYIGFEEPEMTIPSRISGHEIIGIGEYAFRGCRSVNKITVSDGIEIIENGAFYECEALSNIRLPDTLRRIGGKSKSSHIDGAFCETGLTEIVIPQSVEYLGEGSFSKCGKLRQAILPDALQEIPEFAFSYCESLTDVHFPRNLKVIGSFAFDGCPLTEEVHIPYGTEKICSFSFRRSLYHKTKAFYIPPTVTFIEGFAFFGLPGSLTIYCAAGSAAMEFARKRNMKIAKADF